MKDTAALRAVKSRAVTRVVDWVDQRLLWFGLSVLMFLLLVAVLSPQIFITIPAGYAGVLFKRFQGGTDIEQVYDEGFHVVLPWNTMFVYDVRYQNISKKFDAHSFDGLNVSVDVAFRFRATKRNVPLLHKYVGPDYIDKLIVPDMGARVREEIGRHLPVEVYSTERLAIEARIRESMRKAFEMNPESDSLLERVEFVELDDIFLREVGLPETLQQSMVEKNQQQQLMLEYDYRVAREQREAERKRIEAQGIRDFHEIVGDGITSHYLMWKALDATLQLAQSPNTKLVMIGAGQTGLPVLLGSLDSLMTDSQGGQQGSKTGTNALAPLANTPAHDSTNANKSALAPLANTPAHDPSGAVRNNGNEQPAKADKSPMAVSPP